jgi:hypothetical protein
MNNADRLRLVGKSRTPRFRLGPVLHCEVLGCGMTDAPIPWPVG